VARRRLRRPLRADPDADHVGRHLVHHDHKLIDQTKPVQAAKIANQKFWAATSIPDGSRNSHRARRSGTSLSAALRRAKHHEGTMVEKIDLSEWISLSVNRAVEEVNSNLQGDWQCCHRRFHGALRGFVRHCLGIYHALTAIGLPDKLRSKGRRPRRRSFDHDRHRSPSRCRR